jgi:plasmid replication initiation protein
MRRDDLTFRMRREQLGELVDLTSQLPEQRRTAEMPPVELVDLLRKDRELDAAPRVAAERFDTSVRFETDLQPDDLPVTELAAGTSQIECPSRVKLLLGCAAAFVGGFVLTVPLWW